MPRAVWNGKVIAVTDDPVLVEGNTYFPPDDVHREYLRESENHTVCGWKGEASYFDVVVDGEVNKDAAWTYADPKEAAREIGGYFAFWKGVTVEA